MIKILNLSKALNCQAEINAYEFDHALWSKSCNPEFKDVYGRNCAFLAENDGCTLFKTAAEELILSSTPNKDSIWETALQCPQCGCGQWDNGAFQLDLYYYAYHYS